MHLGIIKITYNKTVMHFMDDRFMNLGEEVILTLLWQSGASESATVSVLLLVQMRSFACLVCVVRALLTVFTFILKVEARDYGKGCYISD